MVGEVAADAAEDDWAGEGADGDLAAEAWFFDSSIASVGADVGADTSSRRTRRRRQATTRSGRDVASGHLSAAALPKGFASLGPMGGLGLPPTPQLQQLPPQQGPDPWAQFQAGAPDPWAAGRAARYRPACRASGARTSARRAMRKRRQRQGRVLGREPQLSTHRARAEVRQEFRLVDRVVLPRRCLERLRALRREAAAQAPRSGQAGAAE